MDIDVKMMVAFSKLSYQFMDKLGRDLENYGMASSVYTVLAHLNSVGKSKVQKLAEVAFISSGTITHHINKLVTIGYVKKIKDINDKRITWVEITPKGKKDFNEVHKKHMVYLKDLLAVFTNEEKEVLIKQLRYFGKTLQLKGEKNEN